jgi:hypothetical protein
VKRNVQVTASIKTGPQMTEGGMTRRFAGGVVVALALMISACAAGSGSSGTDRNWITNEEIAALDVSTLHEVVQRLRPRWLEVRAARGMAMETEVIVFIDRTYQGGAEELRRLGKDMAWALEYVPGTRAAADLAVPGHIHVEGVIVVHTTDRRR